MRNPMSKKISKETLKELCEQFDTLAYGSIGIKAPCFCMHPDHSSREFIEDVTTTFKYTCDNIMRTVESSDDIPGLKKQIKALQEAFKSQATRLEILNGILNLDPDPSPEVHAALAIIERSHLELLKEGTAKFPHVVFVFQDEAERVKNISWVAKVEGFDVNPDPFVSARSDKASKKQSQ